MKIVHDSDGKEIEAGDAIYSFKNHRATFVRATRARTPGKSGKVLVEWPGGGRFEYYDKVFNLNVQEDSSNKKAGK
jgi:hypothetical protein